MKKVICLLAAVTMCFAMASCSSSNENAKEVEPQISQMKSICELATMKCYYHNVAKYDQENAEGFWFWTKDRKFWVEYAGIVTVGIDASQVKMEVRGEDVVITIPNAQVLSCKVDDATLTKDSFIVANGSASVEAEHQTAAFKEAQDKMLESAKSDTALLANAQQRAQRLLEDYVNNIGNCMHKKYKITWMYIDEDNKSESNESSTNIEVSESTESTESTAESKSE